MLTIIFSRRIAAFLRWRLWWVMETGVGLETMDRLQLTILMLAARTMMCAMTMSSVQVYNNRQLILIFNRLSFYQDCVSCLIPPSLPILGHKFPVKMKTRLLSAMIVRLIQLITSIMVLYLLSLNKKLVKRRVWSYIFNFNTKYSNSNLWKSNLRWSFMKNHLLLD